MTNRETLKRAAELLRNHSVRLYGTEGTYEYELAAALDRMAEQEPVYVEQWNHGCNVLCADIDLWIPRCPHCGMPAPNASPQPTPEDVRDAARYRKLRKGPTDWYIGPEYSTYNDKIVDGEYYNHWGEDLDAAVDAMKEKP